MEMRQKSYQAYTLGVSPINTFQTALTFHPMLNFFVAFRVCARYHIADEMRFPLDQFCSVFVVTAAELLVPLEREGELG